MKYLTIEPVQYLMRYGTGVFTLSFLFSIAATGCDAQNEVPAQDEELADELGERLAVNGCDDGDCAGVAAAALSGTVTLRAGNGGKFVSADLNRSTRGELIADRDVAAAWERFDVVDNGDGSISLRAQANGAYVTAENAGASSLRANRAGIGLWEKFQVTNHSDGSLSLKAQVNGKYVTADSSTAAMYAGATGIGAAQRFTPSGGALPATLRAGADAKGIRLGAAINPDHLGEADYSAAVTADFNTVVAENVMKMQLLQPQEGTFTFAKADSLVQFAKSHNMAVRGHTLLWHNQVPSWVFAKDASQLKSVLQTHIDRVLTHFGSDIYAWDVANEVIKDDGSGFRNRTETGNNYSPWAGSLTDDSILREAFYRAAAIRQQRGYNIKLFLCDYSNEAKGGAKAEKFYQVVAAWKRAGVPIDGVAFQLHQSARSTLNTAAIAANLDRFKALGLEVHFSEVDVRFAFADGITAEELSQQAGVFRSLMQLYLANRDVVTSFLIWGVADKYTWLPTSWTTEGKPLLRDDTFQPKPAHTALREALR
jgi:endo-1,4-beta-xylanase